MTEAAETEKQPWERVLWKKQNYPDNYISPDFFRVTKKRLKASTSEALVCCLPVTQEICSCLYMVSVFAGLSQSLLLPRTVLIVTTLYAVLGYCRNPPGAGVLQTAVLSIALCGGLCSVVQSLTASVATDTVYACATVLLVLHVVLHDYGSDVLVSNDTLSHNVGIFACVCLASRLASYWQVFAFTTTGIAVFARHEAKKQPTTLVTVAVTSLALTVTTVAVWQCVPPLLPLLLGAVLLANCVLPLLYVRLQHHRQNIYGPWDEARIEQRCNEP